MTGALKSMKCKCGFTLHEKHAGDRTLGARMATHQRFCSVASPNAAAAQRKKLAARLAKGRGQKLHDRMQEYRARHPAASELEHAQPAPAQAVPAQDVAAQPVLAQPVQDVPVQPQYTMMGQQQITPPETPPALPAPAENAPSGPETAPAAANAAQQAQFDAGAIKGLIARATGGQRPQQPAGYSGQQIAVLTQPAQAQAGDAQPNNAQPKPKPTRKAKDVVNWGTKDWIDLADELHKAEGSIAIALTKCDDAEMPDGMRKGMNGVLGRLLTIMWDELDLSVAVKVMVTLYVVLQVSYMGHVGKSVHDMKKLIKEAAAQEQQRQREQ